MKIKRIDHIGINVEDLETVKSFFIGLGFTLQGEMAMQGELVDSVTGLKDVKDDLVMLQAPDGQLSLEIVKYHQPIDERNIQPVQANTLGMRHLCFQVEGLDEIVESLRQKGYDLMGKVQNYENVWNLCYVYGPEGIIVELAEKL